MGKRKPARYNSCHHPQTKQAITATLTESYGQFVGRHEVVFIVLPLLVFGLLGLGILKMEYESDVEHLYTPINSQAAQDRDKMKASFPDRTGTNYNTYSLNVEDRYGEIIAISEGNIFSNTSTSDMRNLVDTIKQFEVDFEGRTLHYSDVCARASDMCVISGGFLLQDDFLSSLEQRNVTYPLWNDVDISFFVSGVNVSGEVLQSASVMKLTFHLRQDNDTMQEYALLWEDAFISNMSSLSATFFPIGVSFATSQSLGDELNENTNGDVFWFSLSFTLLITYASFVSGGDCVSSKSHVTRAGVMAAGLGILGSFGLMSLCGVKFVNIVGIMPFLVLSVGVDDMFLMVSAWADTNQYGDDWDIPKRLGHTFRLAGIGMTITSLTDLVAFLVGYSSVFLSVKNFCLYTVFGMGNAVLLMPVILSLVGPMPKDDHPSPHNLSEQGDKNIYKVEDECAPGSASRSTSSVSTLNRSELASTGSFAVSNVGYVSTNVT
ncbi:patched domain-containing protein 3-like [Haliotis rufescens]|uniref:patched domain-containing protein 3-like n=1 Tax=Haliotis rufescens TaxID=6454 RepID=UPI00201F3F4C|nr:patched domain-containing protein 3-like [Haliotis rufescens]